MMNKVNWRALTHCGSKIKHYEQETFNEISWQCLKSVKGNNTEKFLNQYTYIYIKEEVFRKRLFERIIHYLSVNEFSIVSDIKLPLGRMESHCLWRYQWNAASADRIRLTELIYANSTGHLLILRDNLWSGFIPASTRLYTLKGSSKFPEMRTERHIRTLVGMRNRVMTFIHCPDCLLYTSPSPRDRG